MKERRAGDEVQVRPMRVRIRVRARRAHNEAQVRPNTEATGSMCTLPIPYGCQFIPLYLPVLVHLTLL